MITEQQRTKRATTLGASDVAAIFGLDPWKNAYDVYLEKTGQLEPLVPTKAMQLGTLLEGYLVDWAEEGDDDWPGLGTLERDPPTYRGNQFVAHPDAMTEAGEPVEAKTHHFGGTQGNWGESGSADVPDHVAIQVQTQIACTTATQGWVVALLGKGLRWYRLPANLRVIELIREQAERFTKEHIEARVPPPDIVPNLEVLKRVRREPEKVIDLSVDLYSNWHVAKECRKLAEKEESQCKAALLTALGGAEAGDIDDGETKVRITYLEQSRNSIDHKRLAIEHPDLAREYATETRYRVLREKKI